MQWRTALSRIMKSIIRIRNRSICIEEIKEIIDFYWAWRAMYDARPAYITYVYERLFVVTNIKTILSNDIILPTNIEGIIEMLEGAGINVIK